MGILRSKNWKSIFLPVFCFLYLGDKVPNQLPHWPRLIQRAPGTMNHARAAGKIINFFQDTELSGHQSTKFTKSPQAKNSLIPGQKAEVSMFKMQIIFVSHFSHNVELKEEGKCTAAVQEGEIRSHHIMVPL